MTPREENDAAARADARRRRLDALAQRTAEAAAIHQGDSSAVLEERARALAQAAGSPAPADRFTVVSVRIAREHFAIEAAHVREVMRLPEFAQLPGAEPPLFGVTDWRGELLLLLDIRRSVGLSPTALNDLRHVVVLRGGTGPVGVLVDEVLGMATVRAGDVRPMGGPAGVSRALVRGVTSEALAVLETTALTRVLE